MGADIYIDIFVRVLVSMMFSFLDLSYPKCYFFMQVIDEGYCYVDLLIL